MDRQTPLLRVENLKKHFGNLTVLDGISFSVKEEEILGIAGPNGAGKTTLFNLISALLPLTSGDIFFKGQRITNLKPYQVCSIGITRTYQIPVVFPTLTVRKNISIGAIFGNKSIPKRTIHRWVDEILDLLQMGSIQNASSDNLSLYHKKLVMLGAALATGPKLLLLDEPLAGLTYNEIEHFMKIVSKLNKEHKITVIMIEHLIDWLRYISEEMLVIHNGVVMVYGPPDRVVKDPSVIDIYLGRETDEPQG